MRKRLERFLFGLRPRKEWLVPPGLRLPWGLLNPKDLEMPDPGRQYMEDSLKHMNPEFLRRMQQMQRPTSRSSENQSYWRNRRLINSGKIPTSLLV